MIKNESQIYDGRLEAEQMLVECIEKLVLTDNLNSAVRSVLEALIRYYDADRAYAFEFNWDENTMTNTFEVCRKGVRAERARLQDISIDLISPWVDAFHDMEQKVYVIEDVGDLRTDPVRQKEYDCLHEQNIRGLMTVPVFCDGLLHSFLGVDNPRANLDAPGLLSHVTYVAATEFHKQALRRRLAEESRMDPLTGLQNRLAYEAALAALGTEQTSSGIGVGFLDLNGLKYINDTMGHEYGNRAIQRTCQLMRDCFEADMLYRISGDEFVVLWPDVDIDVFYYVSDSLQKALAMEDGIAAFGYTWGKGVDDLHALVLEAEQLMYEDKREYYTEHKTAAGQPRPAYLEEVLQEFLDSTFVVFLQPLYSIQAEQVYGAEALARKIGPDGEMHVPVEFLHVMERGGMISMVDYTVLEQVCDLLVQWQDVWPGLKINCNMSRLTLSEPDYLERIDEILARTGVDPAKLTFEITESSHSIQLESLETKLDAIRSRGIALAIDDMGTEASSLEMLYLTQVETVKLDRSLICKAGRSDREQIVIASMIELCHKLDMYCVAEGIETEAQVELLKQLNCDRLQGYYIGKPMPPEEFFVKFCPDR